MQPVLVTGVSGFIGGQVWGDLADHDDVWGIYGATGRVPLKPERQLFADLTAPDTIVKIVREMKPRCIVHLAALSMPATCRKQALLAWRVNHVATRHLGMVTEEVGSRIILASSDQVFDGAKGNYREGDPPFPLNVYGETKKAAERSTFALVSNAVVTRFNNCYGRPKYRGTSFSEWVLEKDKRGEPITLFRDQFRSPIDVVSLSNIIIELIDHPFKGLIHLGGANRIDRVTFGNMLLRHMGRDTTGILEMKSAKFDPEGNMPVDTSFDITLARQILEKPPPGVETGLALAYGTGKS